MTAPMCGEEYAGNGSCCELAPDHVGPHMSFDFAGTFAWGLYR